jgi:hypothetical protein
MDNFSPSPLLEAEAPFSAMAAKPEDPIMISRPTWAAIEWKIPATIVLTIATVLDYPI